MSTISWARILVGMAAAAAVAGSILVPTAPPAVAADSPSFTPELRADPSSENPCAGASAAKAKSINCQGRLLDPVPIAVPSDLIPPIVSTDIKANCTPGVITPASPSIGVGVTVGAARTSSSTVEENGASWVARGGSVSITTESEVGALFAKVKHSVTATVSYSYTSINGWSNSWTNALQSTYSVSTEHTEKIPAYHWAVPVFMPSYERVRVLWTWDEPELTKTQPGVRAGAVETVYLPKFSRGIPGTTGNQDATGNLDGRTEIRMVAMSPAEIEACQDGKKPVFPTAINASFVGPLHPRYLDELPMMYSLGPVTAPVLTTGSGSATAFRSGAAYLVANWAPGSALDYDRTNHALQLTGNSEAVFWTAGNCDAFTARVGYGRDLRYDTDGSHRDTVEVWSARIEGGQVVEKAKLSSTVVPVIPRYASADRSALQASIAVNGVPDGDDVIIIKTVSGSGNTDTYASTDPAVVIADPRISCSRGAREVLNSAYDDKEEDLTINLAATPEQISADSRANRAPDSVENGWQCNSQPEAMKPKMIVGQSCGGNPLRVNGQEFTTGLGIHSAGTFDTPGEPAAKVTWEHLPPTCTTLAFGVGFDDEVPLGNRQNHTVVVKTALYDDPTKGLIEEKLIDTIYLNADGRDGIKWVNLDTIGLGSRLIQLQVSASHNWEGHVDIIQPTLKCRVQGGTVTQVDSTVGGDPGVVVLPISSMPLSRTWNHWGPVEVDMSLGENGTRDGRSVAPEGGGAAFAIGGVAGWSSGFGVAPGVATAEKAQIEVLTKGVCQRLTTWVGVDDEVGENGSVRFTVYADGAAKVTSDILRGGDDPEFLSVDISDALVVTLSVDNAVGSNAYDHANWAEPTLYCDDDPQLVRTIPATTLNWFDEENHWGPVEKDKSLGEQAAGDGRKIRIGSFGDFPTGLGMAPAVGGTIAMVSFTVPAGCRSFSTWVGVDNEVGNNGSVRFWLWRNFSHVANSDLKRGGQDPDFLRIPVIPGETLTLTVDHGGDGNAYDHASWGAPTFYCG